MLREFGVEELSDFFLELAHSDRLRSLSLIEKERLKLTHISERLNLSMQETSRHLSRLRDTKLIGKDADGFYYLTPFGRITLHLLPGYSFILKNRDYFQDHDPSSLPHELIQRIGELEKYEPGKGVMQVLHMALIILGEAKEYVWILTDQVMTPTIPMIEEGYAKDVEFRILLPEQLTLPSGFQLPKPAPTSLIEVRWLDEVKVCVMMNEVLAGLCLPNSAGKIDFSTGFASRDSDFHRWCGDLFLHYWEKAKKPYRRM
jgi:predicted transcriptional regulator